MRFSSGLHNYKARMYDSSIMQFLSVDPLHEFANPYSYVGSNPINFTDPTGMSGWVIIRQLNPETGQIEERRVWELDTYMVTATRIDSNWDDDWGGNSNNYNHDSGDWPPDSNTGSSRSGGGNNSNSGNGHVVWDNQFGPIGSSSDLINRPIFGHEDLRREMREVTSFGIEVNVISISLGIVGFELVEYGKDVNLFFFATTPSLSFYLGKTNSKNPKNYNGLFLSGNLGLDGLSFTRSVGMEFDNRGNFRNTGVETSYWGIGTNQGIGYSFSYYYNLGKL